MELNTYVTLSCPFEETSGSTKVCRNGITQQVKGTNREQALNAVRDRMVNHVSTWHDVEWGSAQHLVTQQQPTYWQQSEPKAAAAVVEPRGGAEEDDDDEGTKMVSRNDNSGGGTGWTSRGLPYHECRQMIMKMSCPLGNASSTNTICRCGMTLDSISNVGPGLQTLRQQMIDHIKHDHEVTTNKAEEMGLAEPIKIWHPAAAGNHQSESRRGSRSPRRSSASSASGATAPPIGQRRATAPPIGQRR